MRYFLAKENFREQELRRQFLFEVFHIWFVNTGVLGDFHVLQAFPFGFYDNILIIYGHNHDIRQLLKTYACAIYETNIFIISCSLSDNCDYHMNGKNVFLAPQTNRRAKLLRGTEFGFDFNITEAELGLYNSRRKDALSKLIAAFEPLSKKGR